MLKRLFSLFDNPVNEVDYQGKSHNEHGNDGSEAQCGLSGFFFYFAAVIQQSGLRAINPLVSFTARTYCRRSLLCASSFSKMPYTSIRRPSLA